MLIINTSALRRTVLPQLYERQPPNFKHRGPFPFPLCFRALLDLLSPH